MIKLKHIVKVFNYLCKLNKTIHHTNYFILELYF